MREIPNFKYKQTTCPEPFDRLRVSLKGVEGCLNLK